MSLRALILSTYQTTVALSDVPEELKLALRAHERAPAFLINLEQEILRLPVKQQSKDDVIAVVTGLTDTFVQAVKQMAHEKGMSDLEKTRIRMIAEKKARYEHAADTGIITQQVIDDLKD